VPFPSTALPPDERTPTERSEERTSRERSTAELFAAIAASTDPAKRDQLLAEAVELNMEVARSIARRYFRRGLAEEDVLQAAYVGLVKAVNGFDPGRGREFVQYAVPTISGEVKRYFRDHGWSIRPARRVQELQPRIARATEVLVQRLGRSPRPQEVADHLEVDLDLVTEALSAQGWFTPASLDVPVGEDGDSTVSDLLPASEDGFAAAEARAVLLPLLERLPERDRQILELRFGRDLNQAEIGERLGVTQMHVSRLLRRILDRLRAELDESDRASVGGSRKAG
jgi:RNA polymerase sigma-B factor